jgi:hypothetical protein
MNKVYSREVKKYRTKASIISRTKSRKQESKTSSVATDSNIHTITSRPSVHPPQATCSFCEHCTVTEQREIGTDVGPRWISTVSDPGCITLREGKTCSRSRSLPLTALAAQEEVEFTRTTSADFVFSKLLQQTQKWVLIGVRMYASTGGARSSGRWLVIRSRHTQHGI